VRKCFVILLLLLSLLTVTGVWVRSLEIEEPFDCEVPSKWMEFRCESA
jgi:hypothetical protein